MSTTIATISRLYLYPVKSMSGIAVEEAHVGLDGILGDRQYAFVRADKAASDSFPWMTARQSARMILYKPQFTQLPTPDQPEPPVQVRTPENSVREISDASLCQELTTKTEPSLFLLRSARGLFDCQHISIFSLASVRALAAEAGCAIDARQFRANVYIEPVSRRAFDEEEWAGSLLRIGSEVLTGVTQRDPRCMMINLDPDSGKQDARVLRAVAQRHDGQAGIYANVVRPGLIRVGDAIQLVGKA